MCYENSLRWILQHGAELNVVSNPRLVGSCADCVTPFSEAALDGHTPSMEILLEFGAELDPLAVFYAIRWRRRTKETLRFLVEKGADVNALARKWGTPLFYAVHWSNRDAVEVLLECGADPDVVWIGMTAAESARRYERVELAEMLESKMKRRSRRTRGVGISSVEGLRVPGHRLGTDYWGRLRASGQRTTAKLSH